MRASLFRGKGVFSVEDVPVPVPRDDEALVKVEYCGICGSDLHLAASEQMPVGAILGHEFVGRVASTGKAVSGWPEGVRVVGNPFRYCNTCYFCAHGPRELCTGATGLGLGLVPGAFAEYVATPASGLVRVPPGLESRAAALAEPMAVALHALNVAGEVQGKSTLVVGAGPIGLLVTGLLRARGAAPVAVAETMAGRAGRARAMGAGLVLNPLDENVAARVRELAPLGPDLVFECAGGSAPLSLALEAVRPGGTVVLVGVTMEAASVMPILLVMREITLKGAYAYSDEFAAGLEIMAAAEVDIAPIVSGVFPLDRLTEAFASLHGGGEHAKVLIAP
jgi:2-desacetyl-2-hydroxyethyl bacteriochlorophyllide A dehydrogenase